MPLFVGFCKLLLQLKRKDEVLVVTSFTSFTLIYKIISLLAIVFIIRLYHRNSSFKYIRENRGQDVSKIVRSYDSLKTSYMKVKADIKLVKSCATEKLFQNFA